MGLATWMETSVTLFTVTREEVVGKMMTGEVMTADMNMKAGHVLMQ